jgi:hypothetical protein
LRTESQGGASLCPGLSPCAPLGHTHLVPSTDLAAYLLASDLAPHLVPSTDLAACLLASDLASHLVPGTDLAAFLLASDSAPYAPGA